MEVDLPGMYCDNISNDQFTVTLRDVDVFPESHYNLISITKLMEEGHKVAGNKKDGLTVEKRGRVIKFDIRVKTPLSKLLREHCGVHTFDDLKLKEKLLQELVMIEVTINLMKASKNLHRQSR